MIRFNKPDESAEKWMPCPKEMVTFPGLAYIYPLNRLVVARKLDKRHKLMGLPNNNDVGYTIYNNQDEKVFLAVKTPHKNQCSRLTIKIFNLYGNEVIQIAKSECWFSNKILVWAPAENFSGSIEQSMWGYQVKDKDGAVVLMIQFKDDTYSVMKQDEEVGEIVKGLDSDAGVFSVNFPQELEVELKAVLVAACFLVT